MRCLKALTSITQISLPRQFFCVLHRSQGRCARRRKQSMTCSTLLRSAGLFWYSSPNGRLVRPQQKVCRRCNRVLQQYENIIWKNCSSTSGMTSRRSTTPTGCGSSSRRSCRRRRSSSCRDAPSTRSSPASAKALRASTSSCARTTARWS